jgi:uncharacterized protein with HEPN domain
MKPTREERDAVALDEIREMCGRIRKSLKGVSFLKFLRNLDLYDATVKRLEVIGEDAAGVSEEAKDFYQMEREKIVAFRHLAVHHYAKLSPEQIYEIATVHVPIMWKLIRT